MTVFLDTVGLLAVWDESDQWHRAAQRSTRRPYRSAVTRLRKEMEMVHRLVAPTIEDCHAAWLACERGEADSAGIVDHVSFAIMRRLGLSKAFTNDAHFRAAGFEKLF